MRQRKILYLDDEANLIEEYVDYLRVLGFAVFFFNKVDEAWTWLDEEGADLAAVVLDVMLPHGERYSAASTDRGLLTGILVYRELRAKFGAELPVFFLTNNSHASLRDAIKDDPNVVLCLKPDLFYDDFGQIVRAKLG